MRRIMLIRGDIDRFLVCTSGISSRCPDIVTGRRSLSAYLAGENRLLRMPGAILPSSTGLPLPKGPRTMLPHSPLTNHSEVGLVGAWRIYIYSLCNLSVTCPTHSDDHLTAFSVSLAFLQYDSQDSRRYQRDVGCAY